MPEPTTQGATDIGAALDGIIGGADSSGDNSANDNATTGVDNASDDAVDEGAAGVDDTSVDDTQPEEDEEWTDEEAANTQTDETGRRIVSKRRFDHLYSVYKQVREIKNALGGELPSIDELKRNSDAYTSLLEMTADLESGNPDKIGNFVDYWSQANPDALIGIIDHGVARLRESQPEAYRELSGVFAKQIIDDFYIRAAQFKGKPEYDDLVFAAQTLEYELTGNYRDGNEVVAPDPVDQRLERARRIEEEAQRRAEESRRAEVGRIKQELDLSLNEAVSASLNEGLSRITDAFKSKPNLLNSIRKSVNDAARGAMKGDRAWLLQFQRSYGDAVRSGRPESIKAVAEMFKQRYDRAVKQVRAPIIKEATGSVMDGSAQRHAAHQSQASKTEPTGSGSAKPNKASAAIDEAKAKRDPRALIDAIFA